MSAHDTHAAEAVSLEAERKGVMFTAERIALLRVAARAVEREIAQRYGELTDADLQQLAAALDSWWYRVEAMWQFRNRDQMEQEVGR